MTNITVEKIDQIINKIEENSSKDLSQDEVQELLGEIDDSLVEVKESKHQTIAGEKVEELRTKTDEALNKNWKWGRVKGFLNKNVKSGLEELKNKIVESEEVSVSIPAISISEESVNYKKEIEELNKWRELFPKQSPEEAGEGLKKFAIELNESQQGHKEKLDELQKTLDKVAKETNSTSIIEVSNNAKQMAKEYVDIGINVGKESGLGLIISPVGALVGFGGAVYHGTLEAGIYVTEKVMDGGKELAIHTGDNLTKVTENISDNVSSVATTAVNKGADVITKGMEEANRAGENIKGFAENVSDNVAGVTKDVVKEGGGVAKAIVEALPCNIVKGMVGNWVEKSKEEAQRDIKIAETKSGAESLNKLLEEKEIQIKELKERLERKDKQIEKKDEKIEKLEEKIENLEKKVEASKDKLIAQIESSPTSPAYSQ